MEIKVSGKGTMLVKPDLVEVSIRFNYKGKTYNEAIENGTKGVRDFLEKVILINGFSKEDFKTNSFSVSEDTIYNEETRKYDVIGYKFLEDAKVSFKYDKSKIVSIMNETSKIVNPPKIEVYFTKEETDSIKSEVIRRAYLDATKKADAIALASGGKVASVEKVSDKDFDGSFYSPSHFDGAYMAKRISNVEDNFINTFTPVDITISETLYCIFIATK